jgi:zinc protease
MKPRTPYLSLAVVLALSLAAAADLPDFAPVKPKLPKATITQPVSDHLDNGLTILTLPVKRLPYVAVKWACTPGAMADPRMQAGMAYTVAKGMLTGTATRKAEDITGIVNANGMFLSADADYQALYVMLGTLPESLDTGVELLADIVRNPTFAEQPWEGLMRDVRQQMVFSNRDPRSMVIDTLKRNVCGRHYYARSLYGTDITLARLDAAGASAFHRDYVGADRSVLLFCGMIEPQDARALAEKYFGDWGPAQKAPPQPMAPPKAGPQHIYVLDDVRARQATVTIGGIAVPRTNSKFAILRMLTAIFAAQLEDVAYPALRDGARRGDPEIVQATVEAGPTAGFIAVTFSVPDKDVADTILKALDICRQLGEEEAKLQYVEPAILRLTGELTMSLETLNQMADRHMEAYLLGLGPNWYGDLIDELSAVTPADTKEAAKEYLNPDHLQIIVHADAAGIKPVMDALTPYDVIVATPRQGATLEPPG